LSVPTTTFFLSRLLTCFDWGILKKKEKEEEKEKEKKERKSQLHTNATHSHYVSISLPAIFSCTPHCPPIVIH
jgi:hypothetical protein